MPRRLTPKVRQKGGVPYNQRPSSFFGGREALGRGMLEVPFFRELDTLEGFKECPLAECQNIGQRLIDSTCVVDSVDEITKLRL
jgi:hypothetical protein